MSVLEIVKWPDPQLTEICTPVDEITSDIKTLARNMLETMYDAPGRGLAAPQVGVLKRLFVMDVGWKEGKPAPLICINRVMQEKSKDRADNDEGCLSIPGVTTRISRPTQVRMAWTDLNGTRHQQDFSGFGALCVQHELDHLDGIVTFDHLGPDARVAALAGYAAANA